MTQSDIFANYAASQANQSRWEHGDLRPDDFRLLDLNKDNLLSANELAANRLPDSLFKRIAGGDNNVDVNEWNFEIGNLPFKKQWSRGNFDLADFKRIDFKKDGMIDLNEWKRNGLGEDRFAQLTNANGVITGKEWAYLVNNTVANNSRWGQKKFEAGDFTRLDYDKDGRISSTDWQRNGLSESLFNRLSGGGKEIDAGEWNYFIKTTLANNSRWSQKKFETGDFARLDYDQDGRISSTDWQRNGLSEDWFNRLSGGGKEIDAGEWNYFIKTTLANNSRWGQRKFEAGDFARLDYDQDGRISSTDWQRNGLSESLFNRLSGGGKEIDAGEWNYFINITSANSRRWSAGQFKAADFNLLNFSGASSISLIDWQRNGLSAGLFNQISGDGKSVSRNDWDHFINVALPNSGRWHANIFTVSDKTLLDYDSNGVISGDEWRRGGLDQNLFGRLAGGDKVIDDFEWNYLVKVTRTNIDRWAGFGYNSGDLKLLDFNGDNLVSSAEWSRNGLGSNLFARIAGGKDQIGSGDWNYYLGVSLPNKQRWGQGQFTAGDFRLLDFNKDNSVTLDEWRKNGLSDKLFQQVSGGCQQINIADWNNFINVAQPNRDRWISGQFTAADFRLLDFNGDNQLSLADWQMNGLSEKLFQQISGGGGRIGPADWDYYLNTTRPNQQRWSAGQFTAADFRLLDFNKDNFVSAAEWAKNGLNTKIYEKIFA